VVGRTSVSAQKEHNFWSDRWIALKFLHGFPKAVFRGVDMELLLGDEDVWSVELQYRVKRAINFVRPLDRAQIFTGVSRGCFRWVSYGIAE
jgi:hypothetical protein